MTSGVARRPGDLRARGVADDDRGVLHRPGVARRVGRIADDRARRPGDEQEIERRLAVDLDDKPLLHYAHRQDVVFWTLRPCADDDTSEQPARHAEKQRKS
ncbi:MAG: hypothetical protein KY433_10445 [Actinobacteria bacterium]|nr:hypothetical protein [Actinomycetota bacterium]